MELNAEINKVFGQEMAKLFATQVSEEELMKKAKQAWIDLNNTGTGYYRQDSQIETMVKQALKDKLKDKIEELTSTDEFKNKVATLAQQMVDEITEETHKKIVEAVSDRMASLTAGYHGYGLASMISDTMKAS